MPVKAKMMEGEQNYGELFREYGNEQLRDVLKKRKLYQDEAAKAAIDEALHRELINSEEDLYGPEYRHEPLRTRLFPIIESPVNRNKIRKSLGRGLLLAGLLPLIWGIVRLNAGFHAEGVVILAFGLGWMGCSALLIRRLEKNATIILSIFLAVSAGYVIRWLIVAHTVAFMDVFIIVVLFLLILYGLLFIMRLGE